MIHTAGTEALELPKRRADSARKSAGNLLREKVTGNRKAPTSARRDSGDPRA